ncbi:MAG: hypothetical protein BWY70_01025 [Bacteroidetes bacterium ADurb.Bin408]|nr:MAG: hypothetical protein BWY70_01025 [Bacteroidetes bacterium ADurb.Bin408]
MHAKVFTFPNIRFILYKINHTAKVFFFANGNLYRDGFCFKFLFNFVNNAEEIGTWPVHFINKSNTWHGIPVGLTPNCFGLSFNSSNSTKQANSAIQYTQRAFHLNGKIDMSWCIDNIYFVLLVVVVPESSCGR